MNAPARPSKVPEKVWESRKFWGLLVGLTVAGLALAAFIVCSALLGTPWDPFDEFLQWIATITGAHQLGQGASDVAKWRSGGEATAVAKPPE